MSPSGRRTAELARRLAVSSGPYAAGLATFGVVAGVVDPAVPFWLWRLVLSASVGVAVGLAVEMGIQRFAHSVEHHGQTDPAAGLAGAIESYAEELAESNRDLALVELRTSTSRLLHLFGANKERQRIGELTLVAASALGDRITQASVLLDDLGWSSYESGSAEVAAKNVQEAIKILTEEIESSGSDPTLLELRSKATRHLAVIRSRWSSLSQSRSLLHSARADSADLPEPAASLGKAQLDFSEATMILESLEREIGAAKVEPGGDRDSLLKEGLALVTAAQSVYEEQGDIERQGKALALKVRYLKHGSYPTKTKEAEVQLERIQRQIARSLRALST